MAHRRELIEPHKGDKRYVAATAKATDKRRRFQVEHRG
jgi:hypothetical protein